MKTNGNTTLKVGMSVIYRTSFGCGERAEAKVESIELCECEHEKYGEPMEEVPVEDVRRCCLDLNDGHWAYGYQITEILG